MSDTEKELMEKNAEALGNIISGAVPDGIGFCLMVFSFGPEGWLTYSSNAEGAPMIEALEELLVKMKEKTDESGRSDENSV